MRSRGRVDAYIKEGMLHIKILKNFQDNFLHILGDNLKRKEKGEKPEYDIDLSFTGTIESIEAGGIVRFKFTDLPLVTLDRQKSISSRDQMNTLRGIERFIAWSELGYKPKDDDLYFIHEEIIHRASRWDKNPVTGNNEPIRTSDPRMDSATMYNIIQYALDLLSQQDIPHSVLMSIGDDMRDLWDSWYKWRYDQGDADPLFDKDKATTWENYCENHPVCELCGLPNKENDPLERAHIVSVGSRLDLFNASWNWLRIHHSHHHLMHADRSGDFIGWDAVIQHFPFIKGKIERAKKLASEV